MTTLNIRDYLESVKGIDKSISAREQYDMPTLELKTKRELMIRLFNTLDESNLLDTVGMIYLQGLSINEIAEKLGKSNRTINRYHKLALHKLEKEWKNINGKQ